MKTKLKESLWKYATAVVVVFMVFNPELVELALFVNAVGLETFLMLVEVQVLAFLGAILNSKIKPVFTYVKDLCRCYLLMFSYEKIKQQPNRLLLLVPSQATLMYLLVFSAALSFVLNAYY